MERVQLADTNLMVHPLHLGGNPFGWGADRDQSFAVLDAYAEAGGNFIDTADAYSVWVDGNSGGESETIIGEWMASRGNRDDMVIATKVGMHPKHKGLDPANIRKCIDASLRRLGTDHVDVYYAHTDDENVDQVAVAETFDALVRTGKVSYLGASNFTSGSPAVGHEDQREVLTGLLSRRPGPVQPRVPQRGGRSEAGVSAGKRHRRTSLPLPGLGIPHR